MEPTPPDFCSSISAPQQSYLLYHGRQLCRAKLHLQMAYACLSRWRIFLKLVLLGTSQYGSETLIVMEHCAMSPRLSVRQIYFNFRCECRLVVPLATCR